VTEYFIAVPASTSFGFTAATAFAENKKVQHNSAVHKKVSIKDSRMRMLRLMLLVEYPPPYFFSYYST
jgi:hypothetical protein